jgi:Ca2+-binding EF-hand superfamily protein
MSYLSYFAIAAASLALVGTASAGDDIEAKFAAIDTNADGVITSDEYVAYATQGGATFTEDAVNVFIGVAGDDGELTLEEWKAAWSYTEEAAPPME